MNLNLVTALGLGLGFSFCRYKYPSFSSLLLSFFEHIPSIFPSFIMSTPAPSAVSSTPAQWAKVTPSGVAVYPSLEALTADSDPASPPESSSYCCFPTGSSGLVIPFFNILWVEQLAADEYVGSTGNSTEDSLEESFNSTMDSTDSAANVPRTTADGAAVQTRVVNKVYVDNAAGLASHPARGSVYYNPSHAELHSSSLASGRVSAPVSLSYMKQTSDKKFVPLTVTLKFLLATLPVSPDMTAPDYTSRQKKSGNNDFINAAAGAFPTSKKEESISPKLSGNSQTGLLTEGTAAQRAVLANAVQLSFAPSFASTALTVQHISSKSYQDTKPQKRFLVIINPHGGPGKARQVYDAQCAPVLALANCTTTVFETTHYRHATEIAQALEDPVSKYDAILCCSGDGIPHEIINGLASRPQGDGLHILKNLPMAQLPCGSGNSMAVSLHGHASASQTALGLVKGRKMPIDLMLMTQQETPESPLNHTLSFLTQAFGIIADADLGTENLRWMGGARFEYGVVRRILAMKKYPCDVFVKYSHKSKDEVKSHFSNNKNTTANPEEIDISSYTSLTTPSSTQDMLTPHFGTVADPVPSDWEQIEGCDSLSLFYAGKMPWVSEGALMFPATLPTDGTMDLLLSRTNVSRLTAARMMLAIESGTHVDFDHAVYAKVAAYRLVPKKTEGYLSIDGEAFPHTPFQVEVVPNAACLLTPAGAYAQTGFGDK